MEEMWQRGGDAIDEMKDRLDRQNDLQRQSKLIEEINRKIKAIGDWDCDVYVRVCINMKAPLGSVKIDGPYARPVSLPRPRMYDCYWKSVPGRINCCPR
jgi:hypothetical protein